MSGALAQAAGLATLAGRGLSLLFGAAGAVVLGDVVFTGFEVPEAIRIGGAQRLAVHKMPGGTRVIDAMGRDDAPVAWQGIFLGPDAMARALAVDEMRVAGAPVPLMFGGYYLTVVVESFEADYQREAHIGYSVSCVVLRDESAAPALSLVTTAMQVIGDIYGAALMIEELASDPPMPPRPAAEAVPAPSVALAAAQAAADAAAAQGFRRGSATQAACAASMAVARASVADGIVGAGGVVAGVATRAPVGSIVASLADFSAAVTAAEQLARLGAAHGAVARAAQNASRGSV